MAAATLGLAGKWEEKREEEGESKLLAQSEIGGRKMGGKVAAAAHATHPHSHSTLLPS